LPLFHITVIALVQGFTELLPISSSGHLILIPRLTGWTDQGLLIDVAVHVGTLGAVLVYFWRDLGQIGVGLGRALRGRRHPGSRLFVWLVLATAPAVLAGYLLEAVVAVEFRDTTLVAATTLGFGVVLFIVDRMALTVRRIDHMGALDAIVIGLAQILALVPGTSRSGITMTAGRALGMERTEAARFSMLMSIPVIVAAGTLSGLRLYRTGDIQLTVDAIVAGAIAFVAALIAVAFLMRWLRRATFTPFAVYRVLLGGGLLIWIYGFQG